MCLIMSAIDSNIAILKGIHPGFILERELKKRKLSKRSFALSINEYPQLLGDITKGKRRINPSLSIRIGRALGLEESFFSILQTHHDIRVEKKKQSILNHPDLRKIRPVVFWDQILKLLTGRKINPASSGGYLIEAMKKKSMRSSASTEKRMLLQYSDKQEIFHYRQKTTLVPTSDQ